MEKFINNHKREITLASVIMIIIFVILIIWLFIVPSFKTNKYGDRLDDISAHKVANGTIDEIKNRLTGIDGIEKVDYHNEGRILNFTITVSKDMNLDEAKKSNEVILDAIGDKNLKYYDVQILIDSKEDSDVYPIIGYKSKNSDKVTYGNAGGKHE